MQLWDSRPAPIPARLPDIFGDYRRAADDWNRQLRDTYVPIEDTCRICRAPIWWMEGGLFWLHLKDRDQEADHEAVPTKRTSLSPFRGCTLHRDQPPPTECDTCNQDPTHPTRDLR